ncbi:MAG: ISL3 family transposase [Erysipelothrix sp.]|nr:ISL3 family transposase [Erysipelothrix sp.]NLL75032.1 ISL3 family transposase [Erysipelothrix sp.]
MLGLDDKQIKELSHWNHDGVTNIFVWIKKESQKCPHCSKSTVSTNGTQTVKLNHAAFNDRPCIIHFKKYRYVCTDCGITFMLPNPISSRKSRISNNSIRQVMKLAKDPRMTFKLIADQVNISSTAVMNTFFSNAKVPVGELPSVLCIDEVYLGRKSKKKYAVVLLNFETNEVVDLIYGRSVEDCIRGLDHYTRDKRNKVKYVSTDMYSGFFKLSKTFFPKATICVDSFHVIKLIIDSYQKLLIKIMKKHDTESKEYYLLKNYRHILLKNNGNVEWFKRKYNHKLGYYISNTKIKELLFEIDKDIQLCYELKESYISFNRLKDSTHLEEKLNILITDFNNSSYDGYQRIAKTLSKNKEYILNSFIRIRKRRISNGPIESRNAVIKMIIKTSGGYRNFDNLRIRALYVLNAK